MPGIVLTRLVTLFLLRAEKTEVQKGEHLRKQPNSHRIGISTQVNLNFFIRMTLQVYLHEKRRFTATEPYTAFFESNLYSGNMSVLGVSYKAPQGSVLSGSRGRTPIEMELFLVLCLCVCLCACTFT